VIARAAPIGWQALLHILRRRNPSRKKSKFAQPTSFLLGGASSSLTFSIPFMEMLEPTFHC
jgi:hypothetical protein